MSEIRVDCPRRLCRLRLAQAKPGGTSHRTTNLFAERTLHAPHLLDIEVAQVLRRLVRQKIISEQRADIAIEDLLQLQLVRYPHFILVPRIWEFHVHLSAYDTAYVALAERSGLRWLPGTND